MIIEAKNNREISLRRLNIEDIGPVCDYLQRLSTVTKSRFGPHGFDKPAVIDLYKQPNEYWGYLAVDNLTKEIIAYAVLKIGYLQHDRSRLESYGLTLNHQTDCTYAPSVADEWQSLGIGNALFHYLLSDLKSSGIKRIILWGGVQRYNEKATRFYLKNGFKRLGSFEYNGWNEDMMLDILQDI